jgi:hypothetical protein
MYSQILWLIYGNDYYLQDQNFTNSEIA